MSIWVWTEHVIALICLDAVEVLVEDLSVVERAKGRALLMGGQTAVVGLLTSWDRKIG